MGTQFEKKNLGTTVAKAFRRHRSSGALAVFAFLFIAELLPFLLRAVFFAARAMSLSWGIRGAITLVTLFFCDVFLSVALLRIHRMDVTFESILLSSIRFLLIAVPGVYLEILLFRSAFPEGSYLPHSPIVAILVLLLCLLSVHTSFWVCSALPEENSVFPDPKLWLRTWKRMSRNIFAVLISFACILFLFWGSLVAFPLVSETLLNALYRTVPGTVLLGLLVSLPLTFVLHFLFRIATRITLSSVSSPEDENDSSEDTVSEEAIRDPSAEYTSEKTNNPLSCEEILIEKGLLTEEDAYRKPQSLIRDSDIPSPRELASRVLSALDLIPFLFLLLLVGYLVIFSALSRTTCAEVISGICSDTEKLAGQYLEEGETRKASDTYSDGLADLEAINAYLSAIKGGVANDTLNEETAQVETYGAIFDLAQEYAPESAFPYVLEAKLLLTDGHPDLAVTVLEEVMDRDIMTDEAYLLLLRSYKESGQKGTDAYKAVRRYCISNRIFTDALSYLDSVTVSSAGVLAESLNDVKDDFYLQARLLLWQAYREEGEIETAYTGLYSLLQDERYQENLTVLRAFVETGAMFHIRLDGSTDKIETFYKVTCEEAQRYDRLYTVARAAEEDTSYTLLETKIFVGGILVACKQYQYACSYLEEALHRYSDSAELLSLFVEAYKNLPEDQQKESTFLEIMSLL